MIFFQKIGNGKMKWDAFKKYKDRPVEGGTIIPVKSALSTRTQCQFTLPPILLTLLYILVFLRAR